MNSCASAEKRTATGGEAATGAVAVFVRAVTDFH